MANGIVIKRKVVSHKMFFIKGSALNYYFAGVAAGFAANLVSRFEIYFAIKIQSSAFAPRFQNPSEAAKRRPKIARRFNAGYLPASLRVPPGRQNECHKVSAISLHFIRQTSAVPPGLVIVVRSTRH